jgi:hypothetical protein
VTTGRQPTALDVIILAAATALTRFAFRSHYLYDVDSVNFALALKRFDPAVHQPHPPGYFLYICLGRALNLILRDANSALVAIGIIFSCGSVAMIYALAGNWFGRAPAVFAGAIFVFSPLAWFHGTVALTYIVEGFFSALTGYLCWRIYCGAARFALPAAVVVGIAAGFRPSSLLLLGPLLLFSLGKTRFRQAALATGALWLTLLAWFVPMIRMSGGSSAYFSSLVSLWRAVPSKGMLFNSSVLNSVARGVLIALIYFLCFGCAAILPMLRDRGTTSLNRGKTIFTWIWMAPGLLFFTFIYLKFVNSGYLLALAPPICAWMGLWASNWYSGLRMGDARKILLTASCAAVNTAIFIAAPVYCSYGEVRRFENELRQIIGTVPQIAPRGDTMIVGFDSHFLGYRHAGYYLPGYLTVQFPEVQLTSGKRIFAMEDRDTWLESGLDTTSIHHFILFPLPLGDKEYSEYTAHVYERFPAGALHMVTQGGREYAIGSVADLRFLFPDSVSSARAHVDEPRLQPQP